MRLTLKERKTVTKAMARQYQRAAKKEKGLILDRFVEATGYNRCYAAQLLRGHGKRVEAAPGLVLEGQAKGAKPRPPRKPVYGPEVGKALKKVWKIMDYICGKRLAPVLPELVPRLIRQGELKVSGAVRQKLMGMSAATIDRLLEKERRKMALESRSRTKPGTLLKHQIPVRTFADWDEMAPGFMEMDLVGHDGGSSHGEYCQSFNATDIATGWIAPFAVPTKAQCFVFEAIQDMRKALPFALLGLDSDNGAEFINHQLLKYCTEENLTYTRSRAGKKNDNCYIEQKNWSVIRRFAGYGRFEGEEACGVLNELYALVRDYVNFFMPSMKLIEKVRDGARVTKRYDAAQTPFQRVLVSPHVPRACKERLRKRYASLNPAQLKRHIEALQKKLRKHTIRLRSGTPAPPKPAAHHPWRISRKREETG